MKTIKAGEQSVVVFNNSNVKGLNLRAIMANKTVNEDLRSFYPNLPALIDIDGISLKIVLEQYAQKTEIFSGSLLSLLRHIHFDSVKYNFLRYNQANATANAIDVVNYGAAVKHVIMIPLEIDFKKVINLKGNDKLTVEYNVPMNVFGAEVDTATSYFSIDTIEGVGIQTEIPVYKVIPIQANERNIKPALGDNVMGITFVNLDDSLDESFESARIVDRFTLSGTGYLSKELYYDLVQKRVESFSDLAENNESYLRGQSFQLHKKGELDNCQLDIDFVSANVEASKNFLVIESYVTNQSIINNAIMMKNLQRQNVQRKLY